MPGGKSESGGFWLCLKCRCYELHRRSSSTWVSGPSPLAGGGRMGGKRDFRLGSQQSPPANCGYRRAAGRRQARQGKLEDNQRRTKVENACTDSEAGRDNNTYLTLRTSDTREASAPFSEEWNPAESTLHVPIQRPHCYLQGGGKMDSSTYITWRTQQARMRQRLPASTDATEEGTVVARRGR